MKSPFPGMDPFIEGCKLWEDFHQSLIVAIKNELGPLVPMNYVVRSNERGYVVQRNLDEITPSVFLPDVALKAKAPTDVADASIALAEPEVEIQPVSMRAYISEEFREGFVEIRESGIDGRLVTCIEVLSPSNKRPGSAGWAIYQRKRQALLSGDSANLVEIDLLRGGERMPMIDDWPNCPYSLLVARKQTAPNCRVWPAFFHRAVPSIPIPLVKPDADVLLNFQMLIDAVYERSFYDRTIDYANPITPPLNESELAWLQSRSKLAK